MPFDINTFRAQLQQDGARPNLFEVYMNLPAVINPGTASSKLTFMARTAQLPASTVGIVPLQYFGREIKLAGNRTFDPWTLTIINDEDFAVRKGFERWLNGINQHISNRRNSSFNNPSSYTANAQVKQYGKTGNVIKQYDFIGMFPTELAPIDLDWASNDTIEEYTVTFQYQYWTDAQNGVA